MLPKTTPFTAKVVVVVVVVREEHPKILVVRFGGKSFVGRTPLLTSLSLFLFLNLDI
jgi:hypothetical protein